VEERDNGEKADKHQLKDYKKITTQSFTLGGQLGKEKEEF